MMRKIIAILAFFMLFGNQAISQDLLKIQQELQNALGQTETIEYFAKDNEKYIVKYNLTTLNNRELDFNIVEDFAFRIMTIFTQNNISNFKQLKIITTTKTNAKTGLLATIVISKDNLNKYKEKPFKFNLADFDKFLFDYSFYRN